MTPRHLRAPRRDGEILCDPPLDEFATASTQNAERLNRSNYDCQGRTLSRLRDIIRREALGSARDYTSQWFDLPEAPEPDRRETDPPSDRHALVGRQLVAAGHQPELFHPGVWIKNFAIYAHARRHGALALNLIVDDDTVKATAVPVPSGTCAKPFVRPVAFDRYAGETPFEELGVTDESLFASFGDRVVDAMKDLGFVPMITKFWALAQGFVRRTPLLGERLSLARRAQEAEWGCHNLELPLSRVCQLEGFCWFAVHLLAQLPRFHAIYNSALAEYRRANRVRSEHHPVPALERQDDWLEAPFWVWRAGHPTRRRLCARQVGREVALGDGQSELARLRLDPDAEGCCAVERLRELATGGIRIRTRALTTTIFTRLFLTDLFVHGIGGAKYDQMTDVLIERFFGFEPPTFATLSATVYLPTACDPEAPWLASHARQLARDLWYNPDRYFSAEVRDHDDVRPVLAAKRGAVSESPSTAAARRDRFLRLREVNHSLRPWVGDQLHAAHMETDRLARAASATAILRNREYAFCLYPEDKLGRFYARLAQGAL